MKAVLSSLATLSVAFLISACSQTNSPAPVGNSGVDYRNSKADVVVLSFFDMYCPQCQRDAKYVNQLHALTRQRGQGSNINFYAIGWNNTPLEAEMYRKRFNVGYPVVSDKNRAIANRYGTVKPPLLIALRKQGGQWKEFYRTHKIRGKADLIYSNIKP